jgi:hypothetical protein
MVLKRRSRSVFHSSILRSQHVLDKVAGQGVVEQRRARNVAALVRRYQGWLIRRASSRELVSGRRLNYHFDNPPG